MNKDEMEEFCTNWLAAWSGNRPEDLIKFYSSDAFYRDPARPAGLSGNVQILPYFKKLLSLNPDWEWSMKEIYPTEKGFILKWEARIPVGEETILEEGMDIVETKGMKITRNEVFFDRTRWLTKLKRS